MSDLQVTSDSNLQRVLSELEVQGGKVTHLMPTIAEMLLGAVADVFEAEGPGWEPLAESTKRGRRGTSQKILQDSGAFAGTIDAAWGESYAEAVAGVSYAIFHVTGTERMPKRNPFELGPFEGPLLDEVAELVSTAVTT